MAVGAGVSGAWAAAGWKGARAWLVVLGAASVWAVQAQAPAPVQTPMPAPASSSASAPDATRPAPAGLLAAPPGKGPSLAEALARARDGDVIDLLPGVYTQPVLLEGRRITLRGMASAEPVVFKGGARATGQRALLAVRGGEVTLQNIEFRGARADDGSGAGVLLESGSLRVVNCRFFDNEYGLLTGNEARSTLTIESSVFGMAPKVVGGLHHLLNVGRIARLAVTGTRFQQGFEGHLIKTRARENLIAYNFIHDGQRGGASYEIDIAGGGLATVVGNVIGQGSDSQNPVLVAYGADDRHWDANRLLVAHNTLINYGWLPAWYLRVFSDRMPAGVEVVAVNNLLVGQGVFSWWAPGHFDGNRHATLGMLRDAETYAFELSPGSWWRGSGVDPRAVRGHDLAPRAEFKWPVGTEPLEPGRGSWSPGAYQK